MKQNVIQEKSFAFAVRIVKLSQILKKEKKEYIMSKQLMRSATSVGANVEESIGGQSSKDFIHKLSIAYKEARESVYWLRLLHATGYLTDREFESLFADAEELCKIIGKIQVTIKERKK